MVMCILGFALTPYYNCEVKLLAGTFKSLQNLLISSVYMSSIVEMQFNKSFSHSINAKGLGKPCHTKMYGGGD